MISSLSFIDTTTSHLLRTRPFNPPAAPPHAPPHCPATTPVVDHERPRERQAPRPEPSCRKLHAAEEEEDRERWSGAVAAAVGGEGGK